MALKTWGYTRFALSFRHFVTFQVKIFVILFSAWTVRSTKLKLCTVGGCVVHTGINEIEHNLASLSRRLSKCGLRGSFKTSMSSLFKTYIIVQAGTQTFEKSGVGRREGARNIRVFTKGCESQEDSDFDAKIRGVNSVSGEKLHEF